MEELELLPVRTRILTDKDNIVDTRMGFNCRLR